MTREEADAAMMEARTRRADAVHAAERQFMAHRKAIQSQCPHDGGHGRLFAPNGNVALEWCTTCDFEFAQCNEQEKP